MFSQSYLDIKSQSFVWDWDIIPLDTSLGYAGRYLPDKRRMVFNGEPANGTVFHEAVHYWQHENRADLVEAYQRHFDETERVSLLRGGKRDHAARWAYQSCPFEVEARNKAYEMATVYRDRMAGISA